MSSDAVTLESGSELKVQAEVYLGELEPKDVSVQVYYGQVDPDGEIVSGQGIDINNFESRGDGVYLFTGSIPCISSGLHGYSVRILPKHVDLDNLSVMNLSIWD